MGDGCFPHARIFRRSVDRRIDEEKTTERLKNFLRETKGETVVPKTSVVHSPVAFEKLQHE